MTYTIRLSTLDDIPALETLIPLSIRALSVGHYSERQVERALGLVFGVDRQLIVDGTFAVAVADEDGQVVGCGGWSKRQTLYGGDEGKSGPDPLLDPAVDAARIRAFFIHPDWARRGIGRRLIEWCEAAARRDRFTRMELGATPMGELLYLAMGYVVTDRFTIELADGETLAASHMTKSLTEPVES